MKRLSPIRNSAIFLKLAACAVWFGLPTSATAAQQETTLGSTATDSRLVPTEYNPADALQSGPHTRQDTPHIAQWWSPPPPPPRPPAVLSVRG